MKDGTAGSLFRRRLTCLTQVKREARAATAKTANTQKALMEYLLLGRIR
jgi:hypothetical protein